MEKAGQHAREGDLQYISSLPEDELARLCRRKDEDGRSLLHSASSSGNLELVQLIAGRGGKDMLHDSDEEGWTPLHSAVSCGHEATTSLLLSMGADVNCANSGGRTPLHYAASKGKPLLVRQLLQAGAAVNAVDATGSTPLHRAVSTGRVEAARVLVEEGRAKVDAKDKAGCTPLLLAVQGDQPSLAFFLAAKGADLEAANGEGETPLSAAGENAAGLRRAAAHEMEVDS